MPQPRRDAAPGLAHICVLPKAAVLRELFAMILGTARACASEKKRGGGGPALSGIPGLFVGVQNTPGSETLSFVVVVAASGGAATAVAARTVAAELLRARNDFCTQILP